MIHDNDAVENVAEEWHALRRAQGNLEIRITAAFAHGAFWLPQVPDEIYALFLPFGFSVLEHTLEQMRDDNMFVCKSSNLKPLMLSSKTVIRWSDYQAVDAGREVRNKLIHRQVIPPRADTFRILDEIERELIAWKVLKGPVKYSYSLSVGGAVPPAPP
jgi:hypothetical protein